MKIRTALINLGVCAGLLAAGPTYAAVRTWTGLAADPLLMGNATNWSGTTLPSAGAGDTMLFDGTVPGNLVLTNNTGFDANPGVFFNANRFVDHC